MLFNFNNLCKHLEEAKDLLLISLVCYSTPEENGNKTIVVMYTS